MLLNFEKSENIKRPKKQVKTKQKQVYFLTFQELLLLKDRVSMGLVARFSSLLPMMCRGLSRKLSYRLSQKQFSEGT